MNNAFQTITPQQAKAMMEANPNCLILDVREIEEYITGHVDEALPFTLSEIDAASAREMIESPDSLVLVYCRTGKRSRQAAAKLAALGYTNVYDFGGLESWPYGLYY
ncbi:MAG: rhodanese-like domain-containing protein [Oscillospiraceae bacterium]|jgi:phage shock protein E|nr:rhodanese-like domain-containing protein [Oscillospiraceae bacterium]MBQ8930001.1 rhodanese-like domain-containing protein [Oscillospiraceae bacterium]